MSVNVTQRKLRVATYNIGSLTNREKELEKWLKQEQIDICALQETKKIMSGHEKIGDGYILHYKGDANRGINGVAIAVSLEIESYVKKIYFVSDRIMFITAVFHEVPVHFFSVYSPTGQETNEHKQKKSDFRRQLTDIYNVLPKNDKIYIMGDFNGRVGKNNELYENCQGPYGFGKRNDDGHRLLEFARSSQLVLCNTMLKRKDDTENLTYSRQSQIDFILTRSVDKDTVEECGVEKPFIEESDHKPVVAKINFEFSKPAEGKRPEEDTLEFTGDANPNSNAWILYLKNIKLTLQDNNPMKLSDEKIMVVDEVKRMLDNEPKKFLATKQAVNDFNNILLMVSQDGENVMMDDKDKMFLPAEYGEAAFPIEMVMRPVITVENVQKAVKHYNNMEVRNFSMERKTVQRNDCKDEEKLADLYNEWLSKKTIPEENTRKELVVNEHDKRVVGVHRYAIEIFDCYLYLRLREKVRNRLEHCEFLYHEGLLDVQDNIIHRLEQKICDKELYAFSLVIENVCNQFPPTLLINSLKYFEIPNELINTILLTFANPTVNHRMQSGDNEVRLCYIGLRHESPLSRLLLAISIEYVRQNNKNMKGEVRRLLGYFDRILLLSSKHDQLQETVNQWAKGLSEFGLNVHKTASRYWSAELDKVIRINEQQIPQTLKLEHIGQVYNAEEFTNSQTVRNIQAAWDKWMSLSFLLESADISFDAQCKIYRSIIRPIALQGTYRKKSLYVSQENSYLQMEKNMLRRLSLQHYSEHSEIVEELEKVIIEVIENCPLKKEKADAVLERFYLPNQDESNTELTPIKEKGRKKTWNTHIGTFAKKNGIDIENYFNQFS